LRLPFSAKRQIKSSYLHPHQLRVNKTRAKANSTVITMEEPAEQPSKPKKKKKKTDSSSAPAHTPK